MAGFEEITVTYGEEQFFVTRYNSFKVGPYTYTTKQYVGEKIEDTLKRANKVVAQYADKMFAAKHRAYLARLEKVIGKTNDE